MRSLSTFIDDQTHEQLHTIAFRRGVPLKEAIRLAVGHYLSSYPIAPLAGLERNRLKKRVDSSEPVEPEGDEINFLDMMAEMEAEGWENVL
jgi:hypothetical protein